jgi:hypothetical protein
MTERKIPKESVEKVIKEPDAVSTTKFGRKIARKLIKNKVLRIVYDEENGDHTIITAYYAKPERY